MTTAEQITMGPYKVERMQLAKGRDLWTVTGPYAGGIPAMGHVTAQDLCDRLNAAYTRGQQDARSIAHPPASELDVRPAVAWFARRMEAALRRNDHKGGWTTCKSAFLWERLGGEREELRLALWPLPGADGSARLPVDEGVVQEAADVANFAMMLADNHGPRIGHAIAHPKEVAPTVGACDYRKPGCVNDGKKINGAWVCKNHQPVNS